MATVPLIWGTQPETAYKLYQLLQPWKNSELPQNRRLTFSKRRRNRRAAVLVSGDMSTLYRITANINVVAYDNIRLFCK